MSRTTFSPEIAIEVLRRASKPDGEFFDLHGSSLAVLDHVRQLGIVGLIVVNEPVGKSAIHVPSITLAGEAMLAWLSVESDRNAEMPILRGHCRNN
jgi:hypothetical protein